MHVRRRTHACKQMRVKRPSDAGARVFGCQGGVAAAEQRGARFRPPAHDCPHTHRPHARVRAIHVRPPLCLGARRLHGTGGTRLRRRHASLLRRPRVPPPPPPGFRFTLLPLFHSLLLLI
jgi:hypothetical protein